MIAESWAGESAGAWPDPPGMADVAGAEPSGSSSSRVGRRTPEVGSFDRGSVGRFALDVGALAGAAERRTVSPPSNALDGTAGPPSDDPAVPARPNAVR